MADPPLHVGITAGAVGYRSACHLSLRATFLSETGNNGNPRPYRIASLTTANRVHTGQQYHEFILASRRDRRARDVFQQMALDLLPAGANVLDFGAGTGIDAKVYAAHGHQTFVYEPSDAMRAYLTKYCHEEIERKTIVMLSPSLTQKVQAVTANFAVLNHFGDHASLFDEFSRVIDLGGFVLASMLNPFYLGDARYGWWRANLLNLVRRGCYPCPSESRIHRFSPRVVVRAAMPHFRLERLVPRGVGWAAQPYMFLLFRRARETH